MTDAYSTDTPKKRQGRTPKSTATFIQEAKAKHGNKFIYDAVVYVNGKAKVNIECRKHGMFSQTPSAHLRGQGCPICARLAMPHRGNKAKFIANAEAVHGKGRYNYSKVVYEGNKVKVEIICNQCNKPFWQKPNGHVASKSGCPSCVFKSTWVTQDDFIRRCIEAHGEGSYDYSRAVYTRACDKVIIGCNACGNWFEQIARQHMKGSRCSHCYPVGRERMSQEEFLKKCHETYGYHAYDYSDTVYIRAVDDITVLCNTCGKYFTRQAFRHSAGGGCSHCLEDLKGCDRTTFGKRCKRNSKGIGRLYAIECFDDKEHFYKIGITSHRVSHRLKGRKNLPYKHKVLFEIKGKPDYIYDLETQLHRMLRGNKYEPNKFFTGRTECFTTIKPIEKLLKELSTTEQLQLLA